MNKKIGVQLILIVGFVFIMEINSFAAVNTKNFFKDLFDKENPLTQVELGTELSYIRYAEPNLMKQKGYMYGMYSSATYRNSTNEDIKSISDIFSDDNKVNMFKLDAKISWGTVDYESEGTGTIDDIEDYMFEGRGVAGYDIPIFKSSRITPFIGFGFRYLNDDSGGRTSSTGHFGYKREARYTYMPFGIETHTPFNNGWNLDMVFEYDLFLGGKQKSYLGDAVAGLNTVTNEQNDGYGLRGSIKIQKETEKLGFSFEPFIRYWNIDDSEVSAITFSGSIVGSGVEPKNNSTEYGVKLGVQF